MGKLYEVGDIRDGQIVFWIDNDINGLPCVKSGVVQSVSYNVCLGSYKYNIISKGEHEPSKYYDYDLDLFIERSDAEEAVENCLLKLLKKKTEEYKKLETDIDLLLLRLGQQSIAFGSEKKA